MLEVLEAGDDYLAEEQVEQLDSLMTCCANTLPPDLQQEIQEVLDCYAQQDLLDDPNYEICENQLDSLMTHVNENLDSIIIALDTLIVESLTLDIIRLALNELSVLHQPLLPDKLSEYEAGKQEFDTQYQRINVPDDMPDYGADMIALENGSSSAENTTAQFGESTVALRQIALTLVEEDMFVHTSSKLPDHAALKIFALSLRQEDIDVYTPIHAQVEALWNGEGNADFNQTPLVADAKQLLIQKINFLVNQ